MSEPASTSPTLPASSTSPDLLFRRLTFPQPDGRVVVRLEVWQGGRRRGTIRQERGGWWRYRPADRRVGEPTDATWERGWRTAAECREWVRGRLLGNQA